MKKQVKQNVIDSLNRLGSCDEQTMYARLNEAGYLSTLYWNYIHRYYNPQTGLIEHI